MNAILQNLVLVVLLGGAVAGLIGGVAILQRRRNVHPEIARKLVHIGAGLIALSIPWLFSEVWPVILLTVLASAAMVLLKSVRALREGVGQATGAVLRKTLGEVLFPVAAGLLFVWSAGDRLLYTIPLLILTFADASAALIGVFYGVHRFTTDEGAKTLEGSLAFFQVALLATLTPLLLFSTTGRVEVLLIALLMALLSMLLDAIAWWGIDNFLIPVLSFLALRAFLKMPVELLAVQLVLTLGLMAFVILWRKRTTLNDSAILAAAIYGYLCWTLGGLIWMLPPAILFVTYTRLAPPDARSRQRPHTVPVVLSVGAAGLFWLVLAAALQQPLFFYPYMLTFAAQLAMIGVSRFPRLRDGKSQRVALLQSILTSFALVCIPLLIFQALGIPPTFHQSPGALLVSGGGALASVAVATWLFTVSQTGASAYQNRATRWACQATYAGLASAVGATVMGMVG